MMEIELEPRVKPLTFKVKGQSRESTTQKATNVLDSDLRSHWSTATNTKEWILLELDEPCLLSHIRIYNKSVLEWEIAVGLRYKPEAFVKVRPRCEAPRREMIYPMSYTPCRYVRISCLRGNPIAVFFIQLIGVSVIGLEPEFQPVVTHLLPHIISHKQDIHDMHLQLLQDITSRLLGFLPQLEADLTGLPDAADSSIRFLAMLAGPFYPILHVVNERESARLSGNISDSEASKSSVLSSALTVSSNFEPRRSHSTSSYTVFRPDAAIALLRKAYTDSNLKIVCKLASRVLWKLIEPSSEDMSSKSKVSSALLVDYSNLFGDEFEISDDGWESSYLNVLDIRAVEEGILHILYGCASQPELCSKLAGRTSDLWSALPLVQALLPVLRPSVTSPSRFDDNFSEWNQPVLLQALSQIVGTSSSSVYRPLLNALAGYLASFSQSHAKAACVLIDLCSGVLAPWMMQAIAKIDLVMELLEDLLGTIQGPHHTLARARAALNYIMLALSGHMDDILAKYKEVMHRILFLLEMLEPFLGPAVIPLNSTSAFGDVSPISEKQEHACIIALKVIRTAVKKSAVLLSLESEWRRGSVAPSVLLSILEPHMQLPPNIDYCKSPVSTIPDQKFSTVSSTSSLFHNGVLSIKSTSQDEYDGKPDLFDTSLKMDISEDASLFFAPPELKGLILTDIFISPDNFSDETHNDLDSEMNFKDMKNLDIPPQKGLVLDADFDAKYCNLQANYLQLMNYGECELKASEFRRLALDLHSENEITPEGHDASIDALLLAAECYINPFFTMFFRAGKKIVNPIIAKQTDIQRRYKVSDVRKNLEKSADDLEILSHLERRRDQIVLQILLEAAQLDRTYQNNVSDGKDFQFYSEGHDEKIISLSPLDLQSADAITLVRQNQALLFNFLIQRLKKEHHSMHETLMQSLLLLLHFSTKLFCSPEIVIDIILCSAEYLNGMLTSYYHQSNEGKLQLYQEKVHKVQRRWMLLQNLVIASSGGDEGTYLNDINKGVRCGNLVPSSAWLQKIPTFSTSTFPMVRIIGWMAVSRIAKQYLREPIFLVSDLPELTNILSIYADELAVVNNIVNKKDTDVKVGQSDDGTYESQLYCVIYPDLSKFFPDMRKQFEAFGENILEAVGLQLRSLSSSVVPDLLCWFSDLCSLPFFLKDQLSVHNSSDHLKGYGAKNAKAIILYILEAIVVEHMEAIVPEIPRMVQVLVSLCRVSYCDVSFLGSLLRLLKPIISYSLSKIPDEEKLLIDDSCLNFESLCFDQLFNNINHKNDCLDGKGFSRALTIFILASIFPDLSYHRRSDFLQSIIMWADFSTFEPTTSFHDYLSAFQCVMENCKTLLLHTLKFYGAIPCSMPQSADVRTDGVTNDNSELRTWILNDLCNSSSSTEACKKPVNSGSDPETLNDEVYHICAEEIKKFCGDLEELIYKLNQSMELCWKFHHQLAKKLTLTSSQLLMYSGCLLSIAKNDYKVVEDDSKTISLASTIHWRAGLNGVAEISAGLQKNHCWEAASVLLDSLLKVPKSFSLDNVLDCICSVIKIFCCNAPKIAWRLQSDKWLSTLLARGSRTFYDSDAPLIGLFLLMLGHPEPEQRFIVLKHLEILFSQKVNGGLAYTFHNILVSTDLVPSISELNLCNVVLSTWDQVIVLASTDSSLLLRTHAMFVLIGYMPYADLHKVQSFLASADSVLPCLGKSVHPNCEGVTLQLSLALIASACLYSPFEDIKLIPQNIWRSIENIAMSKAGKLGDLEKTACQALCRLRNEGDEAKEALKEVLSSNTPKRLNPDFQSTRESILQVIADLTSVRSYFEIFSEKIDREAMELEEAEIELDVVQKDGVLHDSSKDHKKVNQYPAACMTDDSRLQQIKDSIRSMEKTKIREDIAYIRQKKAFARHARQKSLEEAALREAELIQELDRERRDETERELERQRLLELERAKTRELRHNLDMEKEREAQREIQREIEQAESGGRSSRREYPSTTHNRPRERNRERENVRFSKEGINRASSGNFQPENPSISSSMPTAPVVRTGSQPFSGHMPTILQSRDRSDDCGSNYDENLDGSKDSGDTGSFGDPESVSALDGQSGGYGSGQRHGSRGTSRQIFDRRERDGRREGKWERKH